MVEYTFRERMERLDNVNQNPSPYNINDVKDESTTVTYIGKENRDGVWMIQKIDTSSDTGIQYASLLNNSSTTSYSTAWTNRATLTYGDYSVSVN